EKARAGISYPLQFAVIDIPLSLQARQFGTTAIWSPVSNLNNPESYTPIFKGSADQLYTIEIKTSSGCVTTDRQMIKIVPHIDIYVPTAFTPNNDGLNDYLHPTLMGINELSYFRIFNRWGQLVFDTKNELPGWDGKINGQLQSTQVVVWMAEGIGIDNNLYRRKGTCTLVR
ncbi:MAG: T9SS type B sorting domain-containing protein, partial [Chitinophagaceae bacterium]